MAGSAFGAFAEIVGAVRQYTELYRDSYLAGLPFQRVIPPVPSVRANTQWGLAQFGVPGGWEDVSSEHLAYATTHSGVLMGAGIHEPGEGTIMAGAVDFSKESGPESDPANVKIAIFKHFAERREQAIGSRIAEQRLFRVGDDGALVIWFSGFPDGDNHAEVWGVHGQYIFHIVGEGPTRSQVHWGQVLYTILGSWTWIA